MSRSVRCETGSVGVGVVGGQERGCEVTYGKDRGDVDDPVRKGGDGDEDAGDEVQRQHDALRDGLCGVLVVDDRRDGVAEAAERERADDDGERERGRGSGGDVGAECGPADDEQHDGRCSSATTTAVRARPAMRTAAGTGVARRRFRTPDSRWAVTEMTRLMNAAAMMPSVMIPGHVRDRRVDASAGDGDGVIVSAEDRREDHEEQDREREGEELGLAVAHQRSQVVPELVQRHARHAGGRRSPCADATAEVIVVLSPVVVGEGEVDVFECGTAHVDVGQVEAAAERPVGQHRRCTSGVAAAHARSRRRRPISASGAQLVRQARDRSRVREREANRRRSCGRVRPTSWVFPRRRSALVRARRCGRRDTRLLPCSAS